MSELPTFGNCRALELLAQGPVSELYRAIQHPLERTVWVRALRSGVPWSSSLADSLRQEAHHLGLVEHQGIQRLLDFVDQPPQLWLVLEAIDGHDLKTVLSANHAQESARQSDEPRSGERLSEKAGPSDTASPRNVSVPGLSAEGAVALAVQLADALAHMHERGLVHAALDPQHIRISPQGHVVLSGLARAHSTELPSPDPGDEPNTGFELPVNMSPEQVQGYALDARSDVFALGSLLCGLLCGDYSLASSQLELKWEALADIRPRIPAQLARLVRRCLQQQRDRRFASMHTVAEELSQLLPPEIRRQPERAVVQALLAMGLPMANPSTARKPLEAQDLEQRRARSGLLRSITGLLVTSTALLLGGFALLGSFRGELSSKNETAPTLVLGEGRTEAFGSLLVVVEPWAHVFVDGKLRATTPFAQPLLLRPGIHYVRLEHPSVPAVRRTIEIDENEKALLSVVLSDALEQPDAGVAPASPHIPDASFSP